MVTFELTEQDKTDNRWGGMGWIVDSKKKNSTNMQGRVHNGWQST
jgi:hypothetical protein